MPKILSEYLKYNGIYFALNLDEPSKGLKEQADSSQPIAVENARAEGI